MQRFLIAVSASILLATAAIAAAQDTADANQGPAQQIRKLLNVMEESFSQGDAKRLAACWTIGGDFTGPAGERVEGRAAIEKLFGEFFATHKDLKLKLRVASMRIASDDLVLLDAHSDVKPTAAAAEESVLSLVLAKRDGAWLIESARESVAAAPSAAEQLKALAWMVGDWSDQVSPQAGLSIRSACDWTANRTFLIRKFKVEGKNVSRTGTEVIGWDPRTRRIRSWAFDSDGGFGESLWVRDNNRWLVTYRGARPDGTEASATNIFTVVAPDTLTVQSKDRTLAGEPQPDVPEVTLHRQPAKPEGKPNESPTPPRQALP